MGGTCYSGVKKNAMHGDLENEDVRENKKCEAATPTNDEGVAIGCHFSEKGKSPRGLSQGKVSKVSVLMGAMNNKNKNKKENISSIWLVM